MFGWGVGGGGQGEKLRLWVGADKGEAMGSQSLEQRNGEVGFFVLEMWLTSTEEDKINVFWGKKTWILQIIWIKRCFLV